jgi:hypothetical protein
MKYSMSETKVPYALEVFLKLDIWASTWGNPCQYSSEMAIPMVARNCFEIQL